MNVVAVFGKHGEVGDNLRLSEAVGHSVVRNIKYRLVGVHVKAYFVKRLAKVIQ